MILATDLDGTFLAGSEAARNRLIRRFLERDDAQLIYVTGRSVNSVLNLIRGRHLPRPDAMICDVGTFIATADGEPDPFGAMDWIEARWRGKASRIRERLARFDALELQEDFGPNRLGYYYRDESVVAPAAAEVEALGCDPLASDGVFFDVLPKGVNKGSTLRHLVELRGHAPHQVIVAGDTLNDLSMLSSGFRAIAVGGSEAGLLQQLPEADHIHRAQAPGCDGILEGLDRFERGVE